MNHFQKTQDLLSYIDRKDNSSESRGLVPTMGNLHQGHLSLIKKSLEENQETVVSIFVNKKQFNESNDFDSYPRTLQKDLELIKVLFEDYPDKKLIVFSPENQEEVFPKNYKTTISLGEFTQKLCGIDRPGHFDGVTTVIYRLFALIKPCRAYFGLKDYQQFIIIKKMVNDLLLPVKVVGLPTVRDHNGLALSSRNNRLSEREKIDALKLPKAIEGAKSFIQSNKMEELESYRLDLIQDKHWDYFEILDEENFQKPSNETKSFLIAGAYNLKNARLIDNQLVQIKKC